MSQEIDQLAARVAGLVRDEVAAAELRGRSAGHAAGQEEMRREMAALQADNDRLATRCAQLEAELEEQRRLRPAGIVDEEGELREENRLLREQLDSCRSALRRAEPPREPKPDAGNPPVNPKAKSDGKAAKK